MNMNYFTGLRATRAALGPMLEQNSGWYLGAPCVARAPWPVPRGPWPVARGPWPVARGPWPVA